MTHLVGLPDWFEAWTKEPESEPLSVNGLAWILTRPPAVQQLVRKFPPQCVVRVYAACGTCTAMKPLLGGTLASCAECNGRGRVVDRVGIVHSIMSGGAEPPTIKVRTEPGATDGVEEDPADLEVVGYWNGITPEVVDSVLDERVVQQVVGSDKVARNAPCPCGSGKKHKRCCGSLVRRDDQKEVLQ